MIKIQLISNFYLSNSTLQFFKISKYIFQIIFRNHFAIAKLLDNRVARSTIAMHVHSEAHDHVRV